VTDMNGGWGQPPQGGWGPPQNGYGQPPQQAAPFGPYGNQYGNPYAIQAQPGWGPQMGAPQSYKNVGIMMLISGIKSVILSLVFIASLIWVCVGAFWFLTLAGGILEIVYGAQIMSGKPVRDTRTFSIIGLVNAVLCRNVIGIVLEAIALSQLGKPEIEQYLGTAPQR
jgi:hypothetical protein